MAAAGGGDGGGLVIDCPGAVDCDRARDASEQGRTMDDLAVKLAICDTACFIVQREGARAEW